LYAGIAFGFLLSFVITFFKFMFKWKA
jgi:hypothetical protein